MTPRPQYKPDIKEYAVPSPDTPSHMGSPESHFGSHGRAIQAVEDHTAEKNLAPGRVSGDPGPMQTPVPLLKPIGAVLASIPNRNFKAGEDKDAMMHGSDEKSKPLV